VTPLQCIAAVGLLCLTLFGSACFGARQDSGGRFANGDEGTIESVVVEAQRLLNAKGYDAGPTDGLNGPRTTRAILAYQKDHGLNRTGYVDDELIRSLRAGR